MVSHAGSPSFLPFLHLKGCYSLTLTAGLWEPGCLPALSLLVYHCCPPTFPMHMAPRSLSTSHSLACHVLLHCATLVEPSKSVLVFPGQRVQKF